MFRIIPSLEKNAKVVQFVETTFGKLLLHILFFCLLSIYFDPMMSLEVVVFLLLATFFPSHRRLVLFVGGQYVLLRYAFSNLAYIDLAANRIGVGDFFSEKVKLICLYFSLTIYFLLAWFATVRPQAKILKRPVLSALVLFLAIYLVEKFYPLSTTSAILLWSIFGFLSRYFWFFLYWLRDCKKEPRTSFPWGIGFFSPLTATMSSTVPCGKGPSYLNSVEAKSSEELSVIQIKATKLLAWAIVLLGFQAIYFRFLLDRTYLPVVDDLFQLPSGLNLTALNVLIVQHAYGKHFPVWQCWVAAIDSSFRFVLSLSISGHIGVAAVRMLGFGIVRNTYAPLFSISLAEYWNRVYFYFKEILVDFFFYPTYFRYFKKRPRLRLFTATMAAAGLGNFIWHFMCGVYEMEKHSFNEYTQGSLVYATYSLVLGLSLALSQLWEAGRPKPKRTVWRCSLVFIYYCLLGIIAWPNFNLKIGDYISFYGAMFGLS